MFAASEGMAMDASAGVMGSGSGSSVNSI